jgi:hypothetical protein
MAYKFKKHYTRDEARAMLDQVREWVAHLVRLQGQIYTLEQRLNGMLTAGRDIGGKTVTNWVRVLADREDVFKEFRRREIQLKDINRGLVDFPAIIGGKEVFLCWELEEEDIEFWHDLDAGYAGRERL